jgi:hypothetical protein
MFVHARSLLAGNGQRRRSRESTVAAGLTALAAGFLLAGCSLAAAPIVGPDPSDPKVRVRPVSYRSTIGSYKSQRPVEPSDWREQNERVTPRPNQ